MTSQAGQGEKPGGLRAGAERAFRADFAVMRVPLLAVDTLVNWSKGVSAGACLSAPDGEFARALDADRAMLRARLSALLDDEQISEALALASPDLAWGIRRWRADPAARRARSAERSLVRYLSRMASRCSPFGLAAGHIVGDVAGEPALAAGDREPALAVADREPALAVADRSELRMVARIDVGLLRDIVRDSVSKALASEDLLLRRNPGAYRAAGRVRAAARATGSNKYRLIAMPSTPAVEAVLAAAYPQARARELIAVIEQSGVSPDAARALLARLLRNELLIPLAQVTVTGKEPTAQAVGTLRSVPGGEPAAEALAHAGQALEAAAGSIQRMTDAVNEQVKSLGIQVSPRRCVQVDSIRSGNIVVPSAVAREMHRAVDVLARITPNRPDPHLRSFCQRFQQRFGTRPVPLLEALDPDTGLVLEQPDAHDHDHDHASAGAGHRKAALLALMERGLRAPRHDVELTGAELAALTAAPTPLPAAFACVFKLMGDDASAVAAGDFLLVEPKVIGPSGGRLLGRLCDADAELQRRVRSHFEREAALEPGAVLAEVCTAPDTDWGLNVTHRPVLRDWEIECGGYSGAVPSQRLEPADLLVAVAGEEVVLLSAALGRRVLPRWSTALNHRMVSVPAARFLALLAGQGFPAGLRWDWEDLADAPMLPRVRYGRTVLALQRWSMSAAGLPDLTAGTDAARWRRLAEWRKVHELPRFVHLADGKNLLLIDFDNVLSVEVFIAAAHGADRVRFVEAPEVDSSPVVGPDGRYAHEFVLPCTRISPPAPAVAAPLLMPARVPERSRRFEPGSEWLYAKLYGPKSAADALLTQTIAPLRDRLRSAGLIDRWFFIRYADPERHLRVRFHGRPGDLLGEVIPALHQSIAPALDQGVIYRVTLDTYEREVERYGGLAGVELMEAVAEADSDAVIEILPHAVSSSGRHLLAIGSLAALYADSGLELQVRRQCCASLCQTWSHGRKSSLTTLLGTQARRERREVEAAVAWLDAPAPPPPAQALRARSRQLKTVFADLNVLAEAGSLDRPVADVVCSLAHMAVNRLLREGGGHDELRVHDALARLYASQLARARAG